MEAAQIALLVLVSVSTIVIITVSVFLIRLLIDLSKLAKTVISAGEIIQKELEPTLRELRTAAVSVNSIIDGANRQISVLRKALMGVAGATKNVGTKMGGLFSGLAKGISMGIKLFRK
jgi:predicted PurR-regulated permease PerM